MIRTGVTYSDDLAYRYRCWRRWDEDIMPVLFMGLRPSYLPEHTEMDEHERLARKMGYGGFEICSFYGIKSMDRAIDISAIENPIGADNTEQVLAAVAICSTVIFDITPWIIDGPYENGLLLAMRAAAHEFTNWRRLVRTTDGDAELAPFTDWPNEQQGP